MTREQRLREREAAKILKEEELRKLQDNEQKLASNNARLSERHLKAMMKQHEADLKRLNEEEDWFFDCEKCGIYGSNLNDNSPQVSCEKCNVWQHVKCHGISEEEVEDPKFEFICTSCKRKEEETNLPRLPPLKLRLTSASPASQENGEGSSGSMRRLELAPIPAPQPTPTLSHQPHFQPVQPWVDGPSLSPRGQALGPPGIQNSEAAYGSPSRIPDGSSSPIRQRPASSSRPAKSSFRSNGLGSSPPPFNLPKAPTSPFKSIRMPLPQQNGNSFAISNPFGPAQHTPVAQSFNQSFSRPGTAAGPTGSPIKHSPANSPRPANGLPAIYNFNSPHSSFPPSSAQRPSFSPTKHSSPAPMPHMSSPAPASVRIAPSPSQMPAQILPDAVPAPLKHDGVRPKSSHEMSETPIFPPVKSLNPDASPQILSPPVKKSSPAPDRHRLAPIGENGFGLPR